MKTIRQIAVAITLLLATTGAYAGCLGEFRNNIAQCEDQYTFERIGCGIDAGIEYGRCVYRAATT